MKILKTVYLMPIYLYLSYLKNIIMRGTLTSFYLLISFFVINFSLQAQPAPGVYHANEKETNVHHEIKLNDTYFVHTMYETSPPKFIQTLGGYYTSDATSIHVELEFNSNFTNDSIKALDYGYELQEGSLVLNGPTTLVFTPSPAKVQDLDGTWLFGTRGPDTGQDRRGDDNPRKTLKFLHAGHFQWIAYNTETMRFSGTGGGPFTSVDGVYTENIAYFSRDNDRVGAVLNFTYEVKGNDWHHQGKNSKGEPMYEIWARRE